MPKAATTTTTKARKQRATAPKRAADAPKKAVSGYLHFCNEHRAEVKATASDNKEIMKLLGARWQALQEGEKEKYNEMSKQDKARFEKEEAEYNSRRAKENIPSDITV